MAKVKPFVGHTVSVSHEWGRLVGAGTHNQIDVLVLALTKADVVGLIEDRAPHRGDWLAKQLKSTGGRSGVGLGNTWEALLNSGRIDVTQPAVYLTHGTWNGPIYRAETDGTYTNVGVIERKGPALTVRAPERDATTPPTAH